VSPAECDSGPAKDHTCVKVLRRPWTDVVVLQICRLPSSEPESPSATAADRSHVITAAAAAPVARSGSRRSSHSGTSTGSEAPSDDTPVFDDASAQPGMMNHTARDRRPAVEPPPPVPPPRRFAVLSPGSGDVWQRQAVRPATVGVHRRVLVAADSGRSSSPKSCPTSPLLDGGGPRRTGLPQDRLLGQSPIVGGRGTYPAPSQNDHHGAARTESPSAPVTRRSRLPLSPLVRTPHDVS